MNSSFDFKGDVFLNRLFSKSTILLIFLVLIWGAVWPINKLAVAYTPPLLYAGLRTVIGGILLSTLIWKMKEELKFSENWMRYSISAFFNTILFFGLHTFGLLYLPSGMFSVIVYLQPILLSLLAWFFLDENLSRIRIIGLLLGFVGIVIVSIDGLTTQVSFVGVLLALLTGISWAIGVIYVKKVSGKVNAYWMVAMQNVIGGLVLLSFGTALESWSDIVWNSTFIFGLVYGFTFGVPIAYLIYYSLVNAGEASKVGVATFMIPIISVFIGVIFLGEMLTLKLFIGLIVVGISIFMVNFNEEKKLKKYTYKSG